MNDTEKTKEQAEKKLPESNEPPEDLKTKFFEESYEAVWGEEFKEMAIPIFKQDQKTGEWKGGFYMPASGRTVTFWKAVQKNKWRVFVKETIEEVPEMVFDEGNKGFGYKVTNEITILDGNLDDNEEDFILYQFTGVASEVVGSHYVNKRNALENASTSSWARALGKFGIGVQSGMMCAEEAREFITAKNFENQNTEDVQSNIRNLPPGILQIMTGQLKWSPARWVKECAELNWNHDKIAIMLKNKVTAKAKKVDVKPKKVVKK